MPIIQTTGSQRKLQQQYGLEGHPPAPTLAPEIVPVTIVDDLSAGASAGQPGAPGAGIPILDPSDPFIVKQYEKSSASPDPGPGRWAQNIFVNPRGSGVIAMITSWAGTSNGDISQTPFLTSSTILGVLAAEKGFLRDTRLLVPGDDSLIAPVSQCGIVTADAPDAGDQSRPSIKTGPAGVSNTPRDVRFLGYVLRPNSTIVWTCTIASEPIWTFLVWTERAIFPGEPNGATS